MDGLGGNGAKAYKCSTCGAVVTSSDRLLAINGTNRHHFINPMGLHCEFYTFASCPGALPLGAPTEAYTWFPGYDWCLALCLHCREHLGWQYVAASRKERPSEFWGLLVPHLQII